MSGFKALLDATGVVLHETRQLDTMGAAGLICLSSHVWRFYFAALDP
jgi:hypothetical protein